MRHITQNIHAGNTIGLQLYLMDGPPSAVQECTRPYNRSSMSCCLLYLDLAIIDLVPVSDAPKDNYFDGVEQLWVKDLLKVSTHWLPWARFEPMLLLIHGYRSSAPGTQPGTNLNIGYQMITLILGILFMHFML